MRRMESEISQGPAGRPKALPGMQNASQKFSGGGKNKEVGVGTNVKIGKLILSKKIKLLQSDVIF